MSKGSPSYEDRWDKRLQRICIVFGIEVYSIVKLSVRETRELRNDLIDEEEALVPAIR